MDLKCPACGVENWLENQSRCFQCNAILRRCADCANYNHDGHRCQSFDVEVELPEAERPTLLSISTNCARYRYFGRAA